MTYTLTQPCAAPTKGTSLFTKLKTAATLRHQRRKLAALDDAALRDIGISRKQALIESRRAPWDAPHHWLR